MTWSGRSMACVLLDVTYFQVTYNISTIMNIFPLYTYKAVLNDFLQVLNCYSDFRF